eukprot:6180883-Pleurochrysis_carterae.AAC.1
MFEDRGDANTHSLRRMTTRLCPTARWLHAFNLDFVRYMRYQVLSIFSSLTFSLVQRTARRDGIRLAERCFEFTGNLRLLQASICL